MKEIAESFFRRVLERARPICPMNTYGGRNADRGWASQKTFPTKDGTGKPPGPGREVDFKGEKRKNQTHESTTDPDARLWTSPEGARRS